MRIRNRISYLLILAALASISALACAGWFAGLAWGQTPARTLFVNGKSAGAVVQLNGRSYVDVETVAQFTSGSVSIEPGRVTLTFPAPGSTPAASSAAAAPVAAAPGLSRNFASMAIAELAEMREWRGAVGTILAYGVPVVGSWPQDYHDRVDANLQQVSVAATTAADQDALQLLRSEFANITRWANDVVATRQSLNATRTVGENAMQNDQGLAKISNCSRFLSSMLVSGTFSDDPSCH